MRGLQVLVSVLLLFITMDVLTLPAEPFLVYFPIFTGTPRVLDILGKQRNKRTSDCLASAGWHVCWQLAPSSLLRMIMVTFRGSIAKFFMWDRFFCWEDDCGGRHTDQGKIYAFFTARLSVAWWKGCVKHRKFVVTINGPSTFVVCSHLN